MEIQKIYSEIDTDEKIYSVLMSEDELALFSEIQKEKDDTKLKLSNRLNILGYKLSGKRGRDYDRAVLEGDTKKVLKHDAKDAAIGTGVGSLGAAAIGAYLKKGEGKKAMLKAAGKSGAVGAGLGALAGATYLGGSYLGVKANQAIQKKSAKAREMKEQRLDEMKVAEGNMTKAEFAKKWYKK